MIYEDYDSVDVVEITMLKGDRGPQGIPGETAWSLSEAEYLAIARRTAYLYGVGNHFKKFAVGDFCVYNNAVYECTTAVTTAESFNSSKWQRLGSYS